MRAPKRTVVAAIFVMAAAPALSAWPDPQAGAWAVTSGRVRVVCPLTVGGSFDAVTTAITGSVAAGTSGGALAASFAVDLTQLDTGIGLRNNHMRDKYLETGRGEGFADTRLTDVVLAGLDPSAPDGRGTFTGRLLLHGVTQEVSGPVEIRRQGSALRVTARFPIQLPGFGIAKPRFLGVGVRDEVTVHVTLDMESR